MKRLIMYILVLILLTGCSTEYNLEFKDGKFTDQIKIGEFNSNDIGDFDMLEPIATYTDSSTQYYDFNYKDNYLNLNHEYTIEEYKKSAVLSECFESYDISEDKNYYYIYTSGEFKCMSYLEHKNDYIKFNFTTDLEVESNNADSNNNNTYTWIFDDDNYDYKEINIKLIKKQNNITIFITIGILLIALIISYIFIKNKLNNENIIPN